MSSSHTATFTSDGTVINVDIYKLRQYAPSLVSRHESIECFSEYVERTEDNAGWRLKDGTRFGPADFLEGWFRVVRNPRLWKELVRILRADLSYPIWLYRGSLFDGYHRLTKAYILGKKTILVQEWESLPQEAFIETSR
jgi:hypothetical protein